MFSGSEDEPQLFILFGMLPEVGTSKEVRNLLTKGPSRPLVHFVQAVRGRRSGFRSGSEDDTCVLSSLGGCNLLGCFSWWFPEWDQLPARFFHDIAEGSR